VLILPNGSCTYVLSPKLTEVSRQIDGGFTGVKLTEVSLCGLLYNSLWIRGSSSLIRP
jgi:hypothetical protein